MNDESILITWIVATATLGPSLCWGAFVARPPEKFYSQQIKMYTKQLQRDFNKETLSITLKSCILYYHIKLSSLNED